jgi:hypothetical protein
MVPAMVLYKSPTGAFYRSWGENGPEGAVFAANESGYFTSVKFTQWFEEVRKKVPVCFFLFYGGMLMSSYGGVFIQ